MEVFDGSRQLIRAWETVTVGMEEDIRYLGGGDGAERDLTRRLRRSGTRLRRAVALLAASLLLLLAAGLALLLTALHGGRGPPAPDRQPTTQPISPLSGISAEQQQQQQQQNDFQNPSAMLTAPGGKITDISEGYLEWESEKGHAFCQGGFNYSGGHLVVPRAGIYRVFLQITYENKDSLHCEDPLVNMVFVYRDTYAEDVLLLESSDIVSCVQTWTKSIYTSASFDLNANCKLSVKSSHPDLIVNKQHNVFFGAERLP